MNSTKETGRKLRAREKRRYTEEVADEEIEGKQTFSVEDKLYSDEFEHLFVKDMKGEELNLKYFQEHGFGNPIVIKVKTGLGIKVPDKSFNVNDVRQCVGNRRVLDVMDVSTQKDIEMTMKEWCRYYENPKRERLLNVISLEFSHTKLETMVEAPTIVRQVDWVDWVWPRHLKHMQTESTNSIEDMKYPKVQKYCLMSVKGCYTDFHIDFGGTSVWYHILKGQKVFWLIPPSEKNIQLYEQWVLSGKQSDIFFGDTVEQCARIYLNAGYTFFIPTGWIHAVYTTEDSLVFGGNFLHSFGIEKQLRIAQVEDITRVPSKFRYPFYSEMLWYVLQRYVYCLSGKNHLSCNEDGIPYSDVQTANSGSTLSSYGNHIKVKVPSENVHITQFELNGLKAIIMWLSRLPNGKRSVPELIVNPDALLNDAKLLVDEHANDDSRLSSTGKSVLFWTSKRSPPPISTGTPTTLSITAQLRQIKNSSFASAFKHSAPKLSFSTIGSHVNDSLPKRPESPPTRPISSNQYAVGTNTACKTLDQIPSSFAELIAATEVVNQNRNSSPIPPAGVITSNSLSSSTSSVATSTSSGLSLLSCTTSSSVSSTQTISTTTQTAPLPLHSGPLRCHGNPEIVSSIISKDFASNVNISKVSVSNNTASTSLGVNFSTMTAIPPVNSSGLNATNTTNNKNSAANDSSRRRRTRCKKCESCLRADCGECHFCKDMKKFGGPGRMKQSCIARQCMAPVLPHTACCMICGRDGWEKLASPSIENETQSSLMECSKCWEIAHPVCLKEKNSFSMQDGIISEELPNSWECPKCVLAGKQTLSNKPKPSKPQTTPANSSTNNVKLGSSPPRTSSDIPIKKPRYDENAVTNLVAEEFDESETGDDSSDHNSNYNFTEKTTCSSSTSSVASPTAFSSHVRSCARFPLLQEAIKQQQQEQQKNSNLTSQKSLKSLNETKPSSKVKRPNETSRDRLFRSLKGLKKTSEMLRFGAGGAHQFSGVKKTQVKHTPGNGQKTQENPTVSIGSSSSSSSCSSSSGSSNANGKAEQALSEDGTSDAKPDPDGEANDSELKFDSKDYDEETDNDESDDNENPPVADSCPAKYSSTSSPSSSSEEEEAFITKMSEKKENDGVRCKSSRPLRKALYVVRPAPLSEDISESEDSVEDEEDSDEDNRERNRIIRKHFRKLRRKKNQNLSLERDVILPVLPYLSRKDLVSCMSVCKAWNCWCLDPKLWSKLDLTRHRMTSTSLIGLVKRQPLQLNLSWSNVSKRQLTWLLPRLPQLQTLALAGCPSGILSSFCTCNCPLLKSLDISWIDGMNDATIRDLMSAPTDSRPGLMETKTRLRHLVEIKLAGSDITDVSLRLISHHLTQISKLDLSCCQKVTDMGIAVLGAAKSSKLVSLKLSSCPNVSDTSLDALKRCHNLKLLDLRDCSQVTINACNRFLVSFGNKTHLMMKEPKLLEFKGG